MVNEYDEYPQHAPLSKRRLAVELCIGCVVVIAVCAGVVRWALSDTILTSLRLPDGRWLEAWSPSVFYADPCEHELLGGIRNANSPPFTARWVTCIPRDVYPNIQFSWKEVGGSGIFVLTEATAPTHVLLAFDIKKNAIRPDNDPPGGNYAGHFAKTQLLRELHESQPGERWTIGDGAAPVDAKLR